MSCEVVLVLLPLQNADLLKVCGTKKRTKTNLDPPKTSGKASWIRSTTQCELTWWHPLTRIQFGTFLIRDCCRSPTNHPSHEISSMCDQGGLSTNSMCPGNPGRVDSCGFVGRRLSEGAGKFPAVWILGMYRLFWGKVEVRWKHMKHYFLVPFQV